MGWGHILWAEQNLDYQPSPKPDQLRKPKSELITGLHLNEARYLSSFLLKKTQNLLKRTKYISDTTRKRLRSIVTATCGCSWLKPPLKSSRRADHTHSTTVIHHLHLSRFLLATLIRIILAVFTRRNLRELFS